MHNFYYNIPAKKVVTSATFIALLLLSLVFLSACSANKRANELTDITVLAQGVNISSRPEMSEACKGFYVSPEKLKFFYQYAALSNEKQNSNNYRELPCYSSGVAYLADEQFHWVLRAGGIGEFYSGQNSFTKICGVSCCDNVQGVC